MHRKFSLLLLPMAILLCSAVLDAQVHRSIEGRRARRTPDFELYGGYSYVLHSLDHTNQNLVASGMNGWDASMKVPIIGSWLGFKGDVSGSYRNDNPNFSPKAYFFLFGPQVSLHVGRSTLFAHGMIGSAHLNQEAIPDLRSDNVIAVAAGAGLDAGFSRHWAWRVTGDLYNTDFHSTDKNVNEILNSNGRICTGPVFRF